VRVYCHAEQMGDRSTLSARRILVFIHHIDRQAMYKKLTEEETDRHTRIQKNPLAIDVCTLDSD